MPVNIALIIGIVAAVIVTGILLVMVLPEKRRGTLHPAMQTLHDILNFKTLFLEYILKALYVFSTCACILVGFLLLFSRIDYYGYYGHYVQMTTAQGAMLLIGGPIVLRIVYELLMILILAVKNLIEINRKMDPIVKAVSPDEDAKPTLQYCTQCGTQFNADAGKCPNCGKL